MSELFLSIFNTAVIAGWLVLAVLVARLLLKNAPGWAKCALWAIVGLRLIWPFELESILSLVPSAQTLPPAELMAPAPEIHTGIPYLNSAINPTFAQTFQPEPAASVNPLQVVVFIASVLWVIGMIVMAAYAAFSYLRLRRRVAVSMPAGEGVYLCDAISSPFILGLVKPKIYLPSELPREQWDAILSHERAHLARRDHWWKPLGFALLTVFWFHPLLWVAYVLLCRDVELACDEKVIKDLSPEEKQSYSQILLECSMPRKWITACPLAFGETSVKQRIKAVLHYKKPTLWIIIAALVICSVLAVCFLTDPVDDQSQPWVATSEAISNKQYVYTKPGAGSAFYINIYSDGTFQYYAGMYSSHIGLGDWELKDSKLYLYDTTLTNPMTFVFSVTEDSLAYIAAESHPFMYVDVVDGDLFRFQSTIVPPEELITEADVSGKMYVYEKSNGSNYFIAIEEDGTFSYPDLYLSSALPFPEPSWELKDGKLYLTHSSKTFVFRVERDALVYLAEESDAFQLVDVADGGRFVFYVEISVEDAKSFFPSDLIGKALIYEYESRGFMDRFIVWLNEDGSCTYHGSMLSSQMHTSTWHVEGDNLYILSGNTETQTYIIFRVGKDGTLYKPDLPIAKTTLIWVQVVDQTTDQIIGLDNEGNHWRILLTNDMIRRDLENTYGGIWVKYYGKPKQLDDAKGNERYEITALSCWHHVEDETLTSRENVIGWVYDYCLYDVDNDGDVEECIISMGHTSGLFTIHYSVWQDGECEDEKLLRTNYALGFAFDTDENGLFILSSEGDRIYPGLYSNGIKH